jgi:hypothetical protein
MANAVAVLDFPRDTWLISLYVWTLVNCKK